MKLASFTLALMAALFSASNVNAQSAADCEIYLKSTTADGPMIAFHEGVCYLGRESINPFKYADYVFLGFKETDHWTMPAIPIIGIDQEKAVAAIVDNSVVFEIIKEQNNILTDEEQPITAVVPFIMAVVAIDAALIGTMWAVAVSQ